MSLTSRQIIISNDTLSVLNLRKRCTTNENVTDYPSLIDLGVLLNPLHREQHTHIRLWEYDSGQIVAYAQVLFPYCNLYFFIDPMFWGTSVKVEIVAFACEEVRQFSQLSGEARKLDVNCRGNDEQKLQFLLDSDFIRQEVETPVLMRPLNGALLEPILPSKFQLRYVTGEDEVEQCVELHRAAFGTSNMTVESRLSWMRAKDYDSEGDLVIVSDKGKMVAYALCSIHPEEIEQSGRIRGLVDPIGVHPSFQGRGLGKAILLAGLHYLVRHGVQEASFMTSSENTAMLRLGNSVGFQQAYSYLWFTRSCCL